MRFTELGLIVTGILDNYNVVRYHLLHINFLLIKECFKHIIIVICFINKKQKNNIISSIRPLIVWKRFLTCYYYRCAFHENPKLRS